MNPAQIAESQRRLASELAARYQDHTQTRQAQLSAVESQGVLAAAGLPSAIRRIAHMTVDEGRAVTDATPPAATPPAIARESLAAAATPGRALEAIIGTDDSDPINFLARGRRAARAVCRLVARGAPVGTGFLVAPSVLLTNNHVIGSADDAKDFQAEFNFELDATDQPVVPVVRFNLDPAALFATSDSESGIDFTFVAVEPASVSGEPLSAFGWLPLDGRTDKILVGEPAIVVQHPRGELKRLCLFSSELVDRIPNFLHYTTDTDHGSSGSCVLSRSWQVVALHHASVPTDQRRRGLPVIVNEGIRVSSIIEALRTGNGVTGNASEVLSAISKPEVIGNGRPQGGAEPERVAVVAAPSATLEATKIRTKPEDHFDDRDRAHFGYKPAFLGAGLEVPIPTPPRSFADDTPGPTGSHGFGELKYTHYSVIFSASRRLPMVTAVNINGAQSQSLARTDRSFEAADVWSYDPRIDQDLQFGPGVYDQTAFDYGHMVRREDPVWGPKTDHNLLAMANDDTFYMTNCTPQHHDLNTKTWLKLENAVLDAARNGKRKVSVFSGPVLSPQDPIVLGVPIPTAFWKIVAYVEAGRLRSHGFMQWQTSLVRDMTRESLAGLEKAQEYQVPIREIARVTSLDFGPILPADELAGAPATRRRLHESLIESLFPGTARPLGEPKAGARVALADGERQGAMAAAARAGTADSDE